MCIVVYTVVFGSQSPYFKGYGMIVCSYFCCAFFLLEEEVGCVSDFSSLF